MPWWGHEPIPGLQWIIFGVILLVAQFLMPKPRAKEIEDYEFKLKKRDCPTFEGVDFGEQEARVLATMTTKDGIEKVKLTRGAADEHDV